MRMERECEDETESRSHTVRVRLRRFFSLSTEGASPLQWSLLMLTVLALFGSTYSITFLFPFLPDMILYFGYQEEEKGYYSGLVASSMFAGRIFGSFFWGWMADKYGRRPVLLVNTLAVGLTNLAFGFARTIPFAIAMRFLNGLFNGLVGTCRTVLYEISDDTNQAVCMSGISLAWGAGVVLGPLISGYLAQPVQKYPDIFQEGGFFEKFPFILPSVVAFMVCVFSFCALWWKMPETLQKRTVLEVVSVQESLLGNPDVALEEGDQPQNQLLQDVPQKNIISCPSNSNVHTKSPESGKLYQVAMVTPSNQIPRGDTLASAISTKSMQNLVQDCGEQRRRSTEALRDSYSLLHGLTGSVDFIDSEVMRDEAYAVYGLGGRTSTSLQNVRYRSHVSLTAPCSYHGYPEDTSEIKDQNGLLIANGNTDVPAGDKKPVWSQLRDGSVAVIVEPSGGVPGTNGCWSKMRTMVLCELMSSREVCFTILLYVLFSFAVVGWEEVFIVWISTDTLLGGLGFTTDQIGNAIGMASVGLIVIQAFLYPKVEARFGALKTSQGFMTYLIFVCTVIPSLRFLHDKPSVLWPLLLVLTGAQKIAVTSCVSSISIFINNSVPPQLAGTMNGISMTFAAAARTLAPTVSGSMFSWSVTEGAVIGFPFDVNFIFIVLGAVFLSINIVSAFLPRQLEKQKKYKEKVPGP